MNFLPLKLLEIKTNAHHLLGKILSLIKTVQVAESFLLQELAIPNRLNSSPFPSCRAGRIISFLVAEQGITSDGFINTCQNKLILSWRVV